MRPLLLYVFMLISLSSSAQDNPTLYLFNKDWSVAKNLKQAAYFMQIVKESDSAYVCRYYRKEGPMIKWETYRDSSLEIPNGRFAWYNIRGMLDSVGTVVNGHKDRNWYYNMNDSGRATIQEYFENGRFKSRTNYITRIVTLADGTTEPLDKPKPKDTAAPEKAVTIIQRAAEFPGGIQAWTHYLTGHLHTPERLVSLSIPNTKATVVVEFVVLKTGKIGDIFIWRSYEWSADLEAMRVIQEGPDWLPAEQNGKTVIYKHRQSITYQIGRPF